MTTIATVGLTRTEEDLLVELAAQLEARRDYNARREAYYEGSERIRQLGIAVPPTMRDLETVADWPGMAVDVLDERMDLQGFALPNGDTDDLGLGEIWDDNRWGSLARQANLPMLIHGVCFAAVSRGVEEDGEPPVLITVEPPTRMTGVWDQRSQRLTAAASLLADPDLGGYSEATLYLPGHTVRLERSGGQLRVVDRREYELGTVPRLPVVPLVNRPRIGRPWGRSEITRAIISYTDSAVRTMLGMEVAREFYSSPQRYILGATEESFQGPDGSKKTAWETYLGRFLALTRDEDGNLPTVGQFQASSPAPYVDQVKLYAQMFAGAAAIPETYTGFATANPTSADSIRASEARLVKRAERRHDDVGDRWCDVAHLALLVRDGEAPPEARRLKARWRDASTPTRASTADAVMKLVSSGVLPPNSEVTYQMLGFDGVTISQLRSEMRRARAESMLAGLTAAAGGASQDARVAALASRRVDGDADIA